MQYLNTRPLVHGLAGSGIGVDYDLPSRLADRLAAGDLDVALIPSVELFRGDRYRVVSDACIGCRGPVMSVKLLFRTAPGRVTTLATDEGSRTSATLARICSPNDTARNRPRRSCRSEPGPATRGPTRCS